jgi:hypothetical protein
MANLHRNEGLKLAAGYLNTLAAAVLTIGVFTPLGIQIYGSAVLQGGESLPAMVAICIGSSIVLHWAAQLVLFLLKDTP